MPTFSSNYQIKLIGTGEEAGTWGTSTNQNLQRIEQALGESVELSVTSISDYSAGSPSTATWLTSDTADAGAALSQGRAGFVDFTSGSDVGANGVIVRVRGNTSSIYPNRIFLVKNSLSNSRDLKLNSNSTDATNIVTISNGCHALVYTDGTNARNALSKLQIDDLLFPAAADITLADSLTAALEIKSTASNSEFLRFDTSNNHLELAPGSGINTVEIQAASVDASSQSTDLLIGDNDADSFEIFEGTNSYIKFDTSANKKIVFGEETSDLETLDIDTDSIDLATQDTDVLLRTDQAAALEVYETSSSGTKMLTMDTNTPKVIVPVELEVTGILDVDGTSDFSATSNFSATATFSTVDINGGTIDGTTINNSSIGVGTPAAGDFTEVGLTTSNGIHMEHADAYINFDSTNSGASYRGIRRNGTDLQVKNTNSDAWGQPYHTGMVNGEGSYFEVTQTDVSASSVTKHSTSFSAIPSIVTCYLKCTSDEDGYTTGDYVLVSSTSVADTGSTGVSITFDGAGSSDITVTVGDGGLWLLHKDNANEVELTESNWDLVIKAWK